MSCQIKTMATSTAVLMTLLCSHLVTSDSQEICQNEKFIGQCRNSEVIVMTSAKYGRMRLGRCITTDYGHIGCERDVLRESDRLCSGKQACDIPVPNSDMADLHSCPKDLTMYLEAQHRCQQVYIPNRRRCYSSESIAVSNTPGYIASVTTKNSSCGTASTPWVLQAQVGQKILIDLVDFEWSPDESENTCVTKYGYLLDTANADISTICGGKQREKNLYESQGHEVQVVLNDGAAQRGFLLKYQAVGCSQYNPPDFSTIEKKGATVIVTCITTNSSWKVTCVGSTWLGIVGSCPAVTSTTMMRHTEPADTGRSPGDEADSGLPHVSDNHVMAFAFGCITLIICCVIVILGIYCSKRYEAKITKHRSTAPTATIDRNTVLYTTIRGRGDNVVLYRPVISTTTSSTIDPGTMLPGYSVKDQFPVKFSNSESNSLATLERMDTPPTTSVSPYVRSGSLSGFTDPPPRVLMRSNTPPAVPDRPPSCRGTIAFNPMELSHLGEAKPLEPQRYDLGQTNPLELQPDLGSTNPVLHSQETQDDDDFESVKYYILENPADMKSDQPGV